MNSSCIKYIKIVIPAKGMEDLSYLPFKLGCVFTIIYDYKTGEIPGYELYKKHVADNFEELFESDNLKVCSFDGSHKTLHLINFKVTDQGCYYLLDEKLNVLSELEQEYVPSNTVNANYTDYINICIDLDNGRVLNYLKNPTFTEFIKD